MATANKDAFDEAVKDAVTLEKMKLREARDIVAFMRDDFAPDYIDGLNNSLNRIEGLPRNQQLRQIEGITSFLKNLLVEKTGILFDDFILSNAFETASISAIQQADALSLAIPNEVQNLGYQIKGMSDASINETLRSTLINGSTIEETVTGFVDDFDRKVTQQLRIGISDGETISQLTERVKGVINTKTNNAQTIARTVQTAVSSEIREATFEANSDVVKGYEWVSVLDSRTSAICRALDGEVYELDDPKRRIPPAHPNCRSTITPITKSWQELGIEAGEISPGTRRALDYTNVAKGEGIKVDAKTDYTAWLKTQPNAVQAEILGVEKAKLFRENNLEMKDFIDKIGQPLTIKEVKAKLEKRRKRSSTENKPKEKTPVRSKTDRLKEKLEKQKKRTEEAKKALEKTQKTVADKKAAIKKIEAETAKLKKSTPVKKAPPKKKVRSSAEITKEFQALPKTNYKSIDDQKNLIKGMTDELGKRVDSGELEGINKLIDEKEAAISSLRDMKKTIELGAEKRRNDAFSVLAGEDIKKKKPNFKFDTISLAGETRSSASGTAKGLKISKKLQLKVDKVLSDYSKILPKDSIDGSIGLFQNRSKRAFQVSENKFTGNGAYLGLHKDSDINAIYHEVAHYIEDTREGLREKANDFIKRRTKNSPKESLSKYGMKGEYGNADNFIKAISAVRPNDTDWVNKASALYMGKTYRTGSTEALSMGMELFIEDAQAFAEADPDYFEFIVDALR